ncbi:uncharacterized protein KY384_006887 [Bacidia gigantensis]|uniref:uncharacterized protein n=1 Tax=Bacidia gigantensis TaxID=2732470 RepID=UPI001D04159E|nr:uncharacterized protein KY384_006887 [Bacidia gigantensis]KAG8527971.1 hypothetical protein KY384_006887 [Bacidia gigantensis]
MAILNGLEVTVQVDDENVEEFEDPDDNAEENGTFETTKYVEAKSGSSFALSFRVPAAYRMISPCLTFRYAVDDKDYGGAIATNDQQRDRFGDIVLVRKGDMSHSGKRIEMRPFVFSEINIVEDGATRSVRMMKPDYLKVLGTIKCEVFRTKITRVHSKEEYIASLRNQVKTSMPVNTTEKQIKGQALSHSSQ